MARLYHSLLDLLGLLCGVLILALMVGVSLDVAVRLISGRSILWMFEVTEYVLLYTPCLGMAWLAREYGHVAITSFSGKLPPTPQRVVAIASMLFCAGACACVAYWGVWATHLSIIRGAVAGTMLRTPEYLLLWVIPFGFGLTAIEFIRLAVISPIAPDEAGQH